MTAPLTSAEQAYHRSIAIPQQGRRWRTRNTDHSWSYWVVCCGTESSLHFRDEASAQDAAQEHINTCPEARDV